MHKDSALSFHALLSPQHEPFKNSTDVIEAASQEASTVPRVHGGSIGSIVVVANENHF